MPPELPFSERLLRTHLPAPLRWATGPLAGWLGVRELDARFARHARRSPLAFCLGFLDDLGVRVHLDGELEVGRPGTPLVVVANHPTTGIDSYALLALLLEARPDTRHLMQRGFLDWPPLAPVCIPVDSGASASSEARDLAAAHLEAGGCLLIHPAGTTARRHARGVAIDAPWRAGAGHFLANSGASAVTMAVRASASPLFYALSRIHPALGELLAARETLAFRRRTLTVHAGARIPPAELAGRDPVDIVRDLRRRSDALLGLR